AGEGAAGPGARSRGCPGAPEPPASRARHRARAVEGRAADTAPPHRLPLGRDPQEVLAPRGVRGVRADRRADRDAGAARGSRRGVRLGRVLPLLLPVPGGRRGARGPPHAAPLALDVAAQPGARVVGRGVDAGGVRDPAARPAPGARGRLAAAREPGRGGGVKILDRYLLREFLWYMVFGLIGFIASFLAGYIFGEVAVFLRYRAGVSLDG